MLVTICPRCGKPAPARLASPDELRCAACGYDGPPTSEAVPTLHAAREFLLGRDVRKRQLDDARARALSQNAPLYFAVLFAVASVPCTYEFFATFDTLRDWSGRNRTYGGAVLATLMLVGVWIFGILAFLRVKRAQADLRAACAALPPERKGDPARCRVCGGPLPAGDAVVRCPFCATDNFADPKLVSKLAERQSHDATEYEFAVARAESMTESITFEEEKRALVRAVVVPLVALWPMSVLTEILLRIELPVNDHVHYAFGMTRDGECIARVRSEPGSPLSTLVGKRVHAHDGKNEYLSVVDHVYGSVLGNIAVVNDDGGETRRLDPRSLCAILPTPVLVQRPAPLFAVDDQTLYYPDVGGIFAAPLRSPSANAIDLELSPLLKPVDVAIHGSSLFVEDGTQLFRRENPVGLLAFVGRIPRGPMALAPASDSPSHTVFAFVATPPEIYAFDLFAASASAEKLDVPILAIQAIAADGDDVFVAGTDAQGPAVYRAHVGAPAEHWLSARCEAIAVDASALFCGADRTVSSFARKTGARSVLFELAPQAARATEDENIEAIAADATDVYFSYDRASTRAANGFVARVSRKDGPTPVIAEGLPRLGSNIEVAPESIVTNASGNLGASEGNVVSAEGHKNEKLSVMNTAPTSADLVVVIAKR